MMNTHHRLLAPLFVSTLLFSSSAFTAEKPKAEKDKTKAASPAPATSSKTKPYKIVYGSTSWNTDSAKFDQAYMFIREKNTGKIAKLLLEETAPDSSIFSGSFALDWKIDGPASMEAYVFTETMRNDPKELAHITETIQNGKVKPSPIVAREEKGTKIIEVYDTREQAARAKEAYENQANQQKMAGTKTIKENVNGQQVVTAVDPAKAAELAKLAAENMAKEAMRIRLEQLEAQRLAKLAAEHAALSKMEKEKQARSANEWVQKGREAYAKNDFVTAEAAFSKAVELDPSNKSPYFMYGVSLYRNEKVNDAIVALKLSTADEANKNFYLGLAYFKSKEYDKAKPHFSVVKNGKDKTLNFSGAFYLGIIQFNLENYDEAKAEFEWVLDNSTDPALDKQADQYIESIAAAIEAKKESEKKIFFSGTVSSIFDSNILQATNSQTTQGTALDAGSMRLQGSGDLTYRYFYKVDSELATRLSGSYMYSIDSDYAKADPYTLAGYVPYTRKGVWKGKSYRLVFTPGYEQMNLDANTDDTREPILKTIVATGDATFVESADHTSAYTVDIRQEDSLLPSSKGDADADVLKVTLRTQHTFMVGAEKKKSLAALGAYMWNPAKGDDEQYQRYDIGALFTSPWKKFTNATWNTGLTVYKLEYTNITRSDMNFSFLLGMSQVLSDKWTWNLNGAYANNASSDSSHQYSKYSATLSATYNWSK